MTDIEKLLTELRDAGHRCVLDLPGSRDELHRALAAFTAEMPGAIGEVFDSPRARRAYRAALANLEVK